MVLTAQNLYAHKKQYQIWSQHHIKGYACLKYRLDKNEHAEIFQHKASYLSGRTVSCLKPIELKELIKENKNPTELKETHVDNIAEVFGVSFI